MCRTSFLRDGAIAFDKDNRPARGRESRCRCEAYNAAAHDDDIPLGSHDRGAAPPVSDAALPRRGSSSAMNAARRCAPPKTKIPALIARYRAMKK